MIVRSIVQMGVTVMFGWGVLVVHHNRFVSDVGTHGGTSLGSDNAHVPFSGGTWVVG